MNRRTFFSGFGIGTVSLYTTLKIDPKQKDFWITINHAQNVLFPKGLKAPSADEFNATKYLSVVSTHKSFDKSDLDFLKEGAEQIYKNGFLTVKDKDKFLRNFNKSSYGENWTSLLMYYTIEALLADPIYGGNTNKIGWTWLNHSYGVPRPKKRFGGRSV